MVKEVPDTVVDVFSELIAKGSKKTKTIFTEELLEQLRNWKISFKLLSNIINKLKWTNNANLYIGVIYVKLKLKYVLLKITQNVTYVKMKF